MIDRGANPFVFNYKGHTQFDIHDLGHLSNLPRQKSIYFTTRPLRDDFKQQNEFQDPWFYKTGIFDEKFSSVIGRGAAGTFVCGEWFGKPAAFKFNNIGSLKYPIFIKDCLKTLDEKLSKMISIQSVVSSKFVSFYGHYR